MNMNNLIVTLLLIVNFSVGALGQEVELRSIGSFRGIKVSEGIDVYLKKGVKEALKVEVSGTKLSNVVTEVSGDYLKIHMKESVYRDRTVKVYVTYVAVSKLSASSAASIFHEGVLKTNDLELGVSSAGSIELKVACTSVDGAASSAGEIEIEGQTKSVTLNASSAGEIDAYNLMADIATAEASSGASIKLSVNKELEAHASSGGGIRYRGNPEHSNTNSSSGGSVRKSN
jgi:Putative auto-transporter adhesin, head GIN domain